MPSREMTLEEWVTRLPWSHRARQEFEALRAAHQDGSCVWTVDEDGNYHTACDGMFIVLEGTPRENGMNFCCYCGRALTEADDAYRLDMTAQAGGGNAPE